MQDAPYPDVDPDFGNWFAGFIDGEGCFVVTRDRSRDVYRIFFTIQLREDDRPILEEIRSRTGLGWTMRWDGRPEGNRRPKAIYRISAKRDLARLVEILDAHPLRAKKARDYAIWREAALWWAAQPVIVGRGNKLPRGPLPVLSQKLMAIRVFQSPPVEDLPDIEPVALPLF